MRLHIIKSWAHRNLYRFLISREPPRAKGRSKRKRRKSHSVQRRAIDRGDEARSAICTRDRPLRRISRTHARTHARTHSFGLGVYVLDTSPSRCVARFDSGARYSGRKKIRQKRYWEIIWVSLEPGRYSLDTSRIFFSR